MSSKPMHGRGVMTRQDLQSWLNGIAKILCDFRSENHGKEWWMSLEEKLIARSYTFAQAELAQAWLAKGNRYGRRTTTEGDFYPSKQEAESVDMNIVTMEFARRMVKQNADRVRLETRSEVEQENRQLLIDARNALKEMVLLKYRIRELESELEECRKQGNTLQDNNTNLNERVRAMQQQTNQPSTSEQK